MSGTVLNGYVGSCPTPSCILAYIIETEGRKVVAPPEGVVSSTSQLPKIEVPPTLREQLDSAETLATNAGLRELLGTTEEERALVPRWRHLFGDLENPISLLLNPNRGLFAQSHFSVRAAAVRAHCGSSPDAARGAAELQTTLGAINKHLVDTQAHFLVGGTFTLADIYGVCTLVDAFRLALPARIRAKYEAVLRWLDMSLAMPAFDVLGVPGGIEFCEWPDGESVAFQERISEAMQIKLVPVAPECPKVGANGNIGDAQKAPSVEQESTAQSNGVGVSEASPSAEKKLATPAVEMAPEDGKTRLAYLLQKPPAAKNHHYHHHHHHHHHTHGSAIARYWY